MAIRETQRVVAALALALLAACGHSPNPAWRTEAYNALGRYENYFLRGESRLALTYFERALKEASATGDFVQVNTIHLARCALETGVLDFTPCPAYRGDISNPAQRAYQRFLQGAWTEGDVALLPAQYRKFAAASGASAARMNEIVAGIDDPLSRLVAIGVAVEQKRHDKSTLELAADTASKEGWRRPLLVYLGHLKSMAERQGNEGEARQLGERIELILDPLKGER